MFKRLAKLLSSAFAPEPTYSEMLDKFSRMPFEKIRSRYWELLRSGTDDRELDALTMYVTTRVMTDTTVGNPMQNFNYEAPRNERDDLDQGLQGRQGAVQDGGDGT